MPVIQIGIPVVGVAIFQDATKSFNEQSRFAATLGETIQKKFCNGSVALLTGYGIGQRIMISSHLPLKSFNVKYFSAESTLIISDRYIILGKEGTPEFEEFSRYWISNKKTLLISYTSSVNNNYFVLLERK